MTTDQLKPWQPLPNVACRTCSAQAVRRVTAVDGEITLVFAEDGPHWELSDDAIPIERFACEAHAWALARELCNRYGGSNSMPLRMTWRYWVTTRIYAVRKRLCRADHLTAEEQR